MARIFLSYTHQDKRQAEKLEKALISAGHKVWRDVNRIKSGQPIPERVVKGLNQSNFLLIIITKNALASDYMKFELNNFMGDISRARNVLPLKFDHTETYKFSPMLQGINYTDFSNKFNDGLNKLLNRLHTRSKKKDQDSERLHFAIDLALRAGAVVMRFYNSSLLPNSTVIERKNATTSADKFAQLEVISAITSHPVYKDDALVAEEEPFSSNEVRKKGYTWVIDPLDGTTNFQNRIPLFCVAIGVLYNGVPHIGVVYDPVANEVYYAINGSRAKVWSVSRGGVSEIAADKTTRRLSNCLVGTHLSSRLKVAERLLHDDFLFDVGKEVKNVRALGCGQLALAYVASGRMQLFFQLDSYLWDQVAGVVLVQNSGGGIVSELPGGSKWQFSTKDILAASNNKVRSEFIDKLASHMSIDAE